MAAEQTKNNGKAWPTDPKLYQWKGTLSYHAGTWNVLAHCKPRKEDVFLKIRETQDNDTDIDEFTENTKNLINIQHPNLLTPVHAFVHKSEIWVVYPRHSGGPLVEVLTSHYPNGIPDESVVASILYDIANGLHNLHKQQQCHRNIRSSSIHVDIDEGISLLSEFGLMKGIRWKDAKDRRNTLVSPEREPFTDPLILMGEANASWYAGDIYAFGITALQITYGSTPPFTTKNILQKQAQSISTDLYDKKCPFGKSFENLIKECCNPDLDQRIKISKLMEHKFFRSKCEPLQIKQYFSHILKSTEKRINSSLQAPKSFNYNGTIANNDENINNVNDNHMTKPQQNGGTGGGYRVSVEQTQNGGNHDHMNGNHVNNNDPNGNNQQPAHDPEWSFSTSLRKSEIDMKIQNQLENGNTPVVNENMSTDDQPKQNGQRLHASMNQNANYHDPAQAHTLQPSNHNNQSDEKIDNIPDGMATPQGTDSNGKEVYTINRFKVEYGSRLSESGTVNTQIEPSETYDENDVIDPGQISDEDPNVTTEQGPDSQNSANNEQTQKIKRFYITPAKPEVSADECEDANTANANANAKSPPQQPIASKQTQSPIQNVAQPQQQPPPQQLQQPQPQQVQQQKPAIVVEEWVAPSVDKAKWTKEQCSEWVGQLGAVYKQYTAAFVDNGIDGEFFAELDDEILKEIVTSALHRKKILSAWGKLQNN
eukprot:CAMPEP_0201596006 /NCGR_PEP_ID=MMETSP0190_2-20130828/192829_1 /ASSEMBLY_ACC=CAM_ASM_000263 /TAXON_ID=37353 /ORGANISM="Rosalina sp." /LENGTH=708 /DNA_ID=CAMNT_0048056201 /DNA_START=88 /DNA_END=2214 /DNA_ORIENTATION=+